MKGTIVIALQDLVKNKFGQEKWINILKKSDLPTDKVFIHIMMLMTVCL